MNSQHSSFEATIISLADQIKVDIREKAALVNVSADALLNATIAELAGEERRRDGRAKYWRLRARLYSGEQNYADPFLDSDPGLPPDCPGERVVEGLPRVGTWLVQFATGYHGTACAGLDAATIKRKINSLRAQLTHRDDGTGVLKAEYEIINQFGTKYFLARCDVSRSDLYPKPQNIDPPAKLTLPPGIHPVGQVASGTRYPLRRTVA